MERLKSIYEEAKKYFVEGASAGGRFNSTIQQPLYIEGADGCRFYDVDGKEYIDYHTGSGAAFFGHNHPRLRKAVEKAMELGFFMNFDTPYHTELAKLYQKMFPCAEMIRLSNTGTEVTMGAERVARSYTGREIIIKMEGHFHGMHELIWFNHNGARGKVHADGTVENIPDTDGMPKCFSEAVRNVPFNDFDSLEKAVVANKGKLAAIMMEPISYNCGCYAARKDYLQKVRELCTNEKIVLIFDEVISGLRMAPGCAQAYYGVTPDLATFAKAIGGGFSIAALCGRKDVMQVLNPTGKTIMSGTYTGALMPVLASIECMKMAMEPDFYDAVNEKADALYGGMNQLMKQYGIPGHVHGVGARFGIYFGVEDPENDYDWRKVGDSYRQDLTRSFLTKSLERGLFMHDCGAVSPAHYGFSTQHTMEDVNITLNRMDDIFKAMKSEL